VGGLILDSSVPIKAERKGTAPADLLEDIYTLTGMYDVGLTAIGVAELIHGIYRAESTARASARRAFLDALIVDLPVFEYTLDIARLVGRIDGEETMRGNIIPFVDLLIGGTALYHGFSVLTVNLRHFRMIPNLNVILF